MLLGSEGKDPVVDVQRFGETKVLTHGCVWLQDESANVTVSVKGGEFKRRNARSKKAGVE